MLVKSMLNKKSETKKEAAETDKDAPQAAFYDKVTDPAFIEEQRAKIAEMMGMSVTDFEKLAQAYYNKDPTVRLESPVADPLCSCTGRATVPDETEALVQNKQSYTLVEEITEVQTDVKMVKSKQDEAVAGEGVKDIANAYPLSLSAKQLRKRHRREVYRVRAKKEKKERADEKKKKLEHDSSLNGKISEADRQEQVNAGSLEDAVPEAKKEIQEERNLAKFLAGFYAEKPVAVSNDQADENSGIKDTCRIPDALQKESFADNHDGRAEVDTAEVMVQMEREQVVEKEAEATVASEEGILQKFHAKQGKRVADPLGSTYLSERKALEKPVAGVFDRIKDMQKVCDEFYASPIATLIRWKGEGMTGIKVHILFDPGGVPSTTKQTGALW